MFLHREFIPLLPVRVTKPVGPIDPPLFNSQAPSGWWDSSAEILYHAADCVTEILAELEKSNNPLMTPLVGFCAFSAAGLHSYVAAFPYMNLGRSQNASERADTGMAYLTEFGKIWKMGEDWVRLEDPWDWNNVDNIIIRKQHWPMLVTFIGERYLINTSMPRKLAMIMSG